MKIIKYPIYILSLSTSFGSAVFAADANTLENFFNDKIDPQMQLCGVCHVPGGLADVDDGDGFLLYSGQSHYDSFYDAWSVLGKGVITNRLLTMNSDPNLNHTGLQNWSKTSAIYSNVEKLLICWDRPAECPLDPSPDSADLSVAMTGKDGLNNGGIISYSITVENAGPNTADTLEIFHQLPPQVTLNEVTPGSIAYTTDNNEITLYLDSLATGMSEDINITVNTATTNNTRMSFSTSVSAITEDMNPGNNAVTKYFGGGVANDTADLSATMTGQNGKNKDGVISYSITVKNSGPNTANSLEIYHRLPSQVKLSTVTPSSIAYSADGNAMTFYLDSLASGRSQNIDLTVTTPKDNKDKMDFTVSVSALTEDQNPSNNSITAKFGGSFGWLFTIFTGIIYVFRRLGC